MRSTAVVWMLTFASCCASAAEWVDVVGRDALTALYSDTTFHGAGWNGYYRADGRGFIVLANGKVLGRRWFIRDATVGCASLDDGPTVCFRFQRARDDATNVRVIDIASGQQFTARVEQGLPDLTRWEEAAALARDESWSRSVGDPQELLPSLREEVVQVPIRGVPGAQLIATLFQPPGAGPFPVIVLNHGSPYLPQDRMRMGRYRLIPQTQALLDRGFAVMVPMRRGYGASGGPYAEDIGRCDAPQYGAAGDEAARDILSALDWVRTRSSLDANRIVLMGQSAGGFASLAAAARAPAGVVAVVNLAGGRGGNGRDGIPCAPEKMAEVLASYGRTTKVPTLWLYTENDRYFGPAASRAWFKAFEEAGGMGRFVLEQAVGVDGHLLFYRADALATWLKVVDDFLHSPGVDMHAQRGHS